MSTIQESPQDLLPVHLFSISYSYWQATNISEFRGTVG